jgi:hypothetical protein
MCPACIASAAVMAAGAGSTGGILAVCIGKFRKFAGRMVSVCFRKSRRNKWQPARREMLSTRKGISQ